MVRNLIGARLGHGEHCVAGIGGDASGQDLGVGGKGGGEAGAGGSSGAGGTRKNQGFHGRAQLGGQQRPLLHHIGQGILYAPIDFHDLLKRGGLPQARQGAQDVLQLFTLGVENMAQAEFLGRNRGDDLIKTPLAGQRGINLGKRRQ